MDGPDLLRAFLEDQNLKPREFSRRSKGRLGEPELSRYLSRKATPSLRKSFVVEELTGGKVPARSWVSTATTRRPRPTKSAA